MYFYCNARLWLFICTTISHILQNNVYYYNSTTPPLLCLILDDCAKFLIIFFLDVSYLCWFLFGVSFELEFVWTLFFNLKSNLVPYDWKVMRNLVGYIRRTVKNLMMIFFIYNNNNCNVINEQQPHRCQFETISIFVCVDDLNNMNNHNNNTTQTE